MELLTICALAVVGYGGYLALQESIADHRREEFFWSAAGMRRLVEGSGRLVLRLRRRLGWRDRALRAALIRLTGGSGPVRMPRRLPVEKVHFL